MDVLLQVRLLKLATFLQNGFTIANILNFGVKFDRFCYTTDNLWVPFSAKSTPKSGYGFRCTSPSKPNPSLPGLLWTSENVLFRSTGNRGYIYII